MTMLWGKKIVIQEKVIPGWRFSKTCMFVTPEEYSQLAHELVLPVRMDKDSLLAKLNAERRDRERAA